MLVSNPFHGLPFAPVIEPEHDDAIYSGNYHDLLQKGQIADVPILMGHNSLEAGPEEMNGNCSFQLKEAEEWKSSFPHPKGFKELILNLHCLFSFVQNDTATIRRTAREISTSQYECTIWVGCLG